MWLIAYDALVGERVNRYFFGITTFDDLWYCKDLDKWVSIDKVPDESGCSNYKHCRTIKAFKRNLRKHPELQASGEVRLVSRYMGLNVTATWYDE